MAERDLEESHYQRFLNARTTIVERLRKLADDIESLPENDHRGRRREPAALIGQVTHLLLWGVANLGLDRMASWADSVYEIRAYDAKEHGQCGYSIDDPYTQCVLSKGHTFPIDDGMTVHVNSAGGQFL